MLTFACCSGCVGVEPPNVCKFCDGKSVRRDVKLPGESFTCGDGYDYIQHFSSNVACDGPNTEFGEAETICCGDDLEPGGGGEGSDSAASCVGTGVLVAFASLCAGFVLA